LESLAEQLADLFFQGAIVANAFFAFADLLGAEGFGGALGVDEARPAVVGTVEMGGVALQAQWGLPQVLRAVERLPGKSGRVMWRVIFFCCICPNVYIH